MDFSLTTLFVLPSGDLAPQGFKRNNLKPNQFGIFNSRYTAVTTATDAAKSPHIHFGMGRVEKVPSLGDKFSDFMSKNSLIEWYSSRGTHIPKNQISYVGFDGVDATKSLPAGCDETYTVTLRLFSNYIANAWANGLTRSVTVLTPCCEACGDDCVQVDPKWMATEVARKINEDDLLSKFVVATPIFNNVYTGPTKINTVDYTLTVVDDGSANALAAVQMQYPNSEINFKSRNGLYTTYSLSQLASATAPAAVSITSPIALAVCSTCPSGYTLVPESRIFTVKRPLAGTETLVTPANKQTYATAVGTAYTGSGVAVPKARFLSIEDGAAVVELFVTGAPTAGITPLLADIVKEIRVEEATCTPPAGTTAAWAATGTGYMIQRTMRMTVANDCASDLATIQAQYPDNTVTLVTSANCNSLYQIVQTSLTIQEDCGFGTVPEFVDLQGYKGMEWTEYNATDPSVLVVGGIAGVKIEGKPLDKYGGSCDVTAFPYEFDRLRFDVFASKGPATSQDYDLYDRCEHWDITKTQDSSYITGSGEEIKALELRYHSYQTTMKHIFRNNDFNGGLHLYADPNKFYDLYYIKFKEPNLRTWDSSTAQDEMVIIAVPEGTGAQLEQFLLGYFGQPAYYSEVL